MKVVMDCILMVLVIYEIQWDDVDEDGEGREVLQMYTRTPKVFHTLFFFIDRN
jgi:hypothetical protein